MRIAFLGLGAMGGPMAHRLVAAGHDVTVWNRDPGRTVAGARRADTPTDAVRDAEVVITMLAGPDAVEAVVLAFAGALTPGSVLVEMSTIGPDAVAALAKRLPAGVGLVDAPVGGSVGKAAAGELTVFAGGTDADVDRVTPVLDSLGTVVRLGGSGSAAAAKLVVNTALIAGLALLGELRELADRLGVPADELLAAGPMRAFTERAKGAGAHFTMALAEKDLGLAVGNAGPITEAALARLRAAPPDAAGQELGRLADSRTGKP